MAEYKVVDAEKLDVDLSSVADAIRTKGGTSESLEFPQGFVNAVGAIESGGGGTEEIEQIIDQSGVLESTDGTATEKVEQLIDKAEDEKRWFGAVANVVNASRYFENYPFARLPKLPVLHSTSLAFWFASSQLERVDFYIDVEPTETFVMNSVFYDNKKLTFIYGIDTHKCTDVHSAFKYCELLETIQEPLDFSNVNNMTEVFYNCGALKNVFFVPETIKVSLIISSSVLSDESIESILKGLAPVETTQTLTVHISVYDKMLDDKFFDLVSEAIDKGWEITA